jgi:hypothetical protein
MLIINDVFQIKNFMPLFLKGEKEMSWVLVTQKMKSAIFAERRPLCKGLRSLLRMTSKDRIPGY